ncbi:hypothetical protein [Streptosporangium jomthongense]|uniref:Uncharacterized protein n=1 Tax=Streptosporangium jomthongense TaxID=1193683 RepID=A0ABV8FB50_9ACTN
MEHFTGSDPSIVPHSPAGDVGFGVRAFALVQEIDEGATEVIAYGLQLPCGTAATVGVVQGYGRWRSADSAARRLGSDLVWLT